MSIFKLLSATLPCALLSGCLTVVDANRAHDGAPRSASSPAFSAPRPPAEPVPNTAEIDFRIINARAKVGSRDYIFDVRNRPTITPLGGDTYRLDLALRRDSKSSLRGDEKFTTHFYYDGLELIFFGDKNRNQRLDRRESSARYVISHTLEVVAQGNKRYAQARTLNVTLGKKHISSSQRLDRLNIQLIFQAGR